jgi:acyl-coenzyme A synthetase/AMP-(fatty) acid ligase
MYGFESTVLLAMQSGSAIMSGSQFYPLDICGAIASAQRPRILVTTPFHLHSLMADGLDVPPVDLVVSATAPISAHLVSEVEVRFDAPLLEIYGCTETGQIACRQPSVGAEWRLFPGVRLTSQEGQLWASGGHVEGIVPLPDQLELTGEDRFIFQGRNADMINIAGNRSSLAYLNHQLNTLPGVQDGAFFMPDDLGSAKVTRLVAFVVAPGLDESALIRSLREQIHPAFLPRPLVLVDALPRNATGKLPQEGLAALARQCLAR